MTEQDSIQNLREACTKVAHVFSQQIAQALGQSLEMRVKNITESCNDEERLKQIICEIGQYYNDVINGIVYGPYPVLNGNTLSGKVKTTLHQVKYNGPYKNFAEAFKDFYTQLSPQGIPNQILAKRLRIGINTLYYFKDNTCPVPLEQFSQKRIKAYEESRERILSNLLIEPPEAINDLRALPIFSEDSKVKYDWFERQRKNK